MLEFAAILKAIAWPIVVGLIAIRFGSELQALVSGPITRLIDRGTKTEIGATGFKIEAPISSPQPAPETQSEEARRIEQVREIKGAPPDPVPLYASVETATLERLQEEFPEQPELQLSWVLRLYAVAVTRLTHEDNYRIILGAQLRLLQSLKLAGEPMSREVAEPFFSAGRAVLPDDQLPYEDWVGWLAAAKLVVISSEGALELTVAGSDFLAYVESQRLTELSPPRG